jgi:type VI secretion system secreted protein VgrG
MDLGANSVAGPDDAVTPTQDGHLLAIETELGKDVILLTAIDGTEQVAGSYVYAIEILTAASDDLVRLLLGKPVTLWLYNADEAQRRPIHGHIRCLTRGSLDSRAYRNWSAEIVPWLWFLTRSVDCRIFQNLSVPDILATIFNDLGLTNHQFRLISQYPKIEFCVQYRESAFAFVSRLMEHAGIFYWFEHSAERHMLVVADSNQMASFTQPRQVELSNRSDLGEILTLEHNITIRPGVWALNDYDYEVPKKNLRAREPSILATHPLSQFEVYDYPGLYTGADEGARLTRLRMEAEEARYYELTGESSCVGFDPGKRFDLAPEQPGSTATGYLLTEVRHSARDSTYHSNTTEAPTYTNRFVCIPAQTPFRPERRTPKPIVQGPQTALVVGPPGETIYTDQAGRVRLQFHWDRYGTSDDKSSCWVRVSQNSAGAGWGGMFIPHVGHEVIVSFLEGDPDRPMVTGRVYNGDNKKSVALPANKTQTGLRDHSGNEIQMEGKGGVQDVRITAVKDMNVNVTHDYNETVATGNRTINIATGTHTETIKGNTTIRVTNGNLVHRVEAGTAQYFVSGNVTEFCGDHHTTNVNSDVIINSLYSKIFVQAAMAIQLTSGDSQMTLEKDGTITILGKNIRIVGSQSVQISGDTVENKAGTQAKIGVGGQNTVYSKQNVATSGAAISSAAVGEHDISGAVVKIN